MLKNGTARGYPSSGVGGLDMRGGMPLGMNGITSHTAVRSSMGRLASPTSTELPRVLSRPKNSSSIASSACSNQPSHTQASQLQQQHHQQQHVLSASTPISAYDMSPEDGSVPPPTSGYAVAKTTTNPFGLECFAQPPRAQENPLYSSAPLHAAPPPGENQMMLSSYAAHQLPPSSSGMMDGQSGYMGLASSSTQMQLPQSSGAVEYSSAAAPVSSVAYNQSTAAYDCHSSTNIISPLGMDGRYQEQANQEDLGGGAIGGTNGVRVRGERGERVGGEGGGDLPTYHNTKRLQHFPMEMEASSTASSSLPYQQSQQAAIGGYHHQTSPPQHVSTTGSSSVHQIPHSHSHSAHHLSSTSPPSNSTSSQYSSPPQALSNSSGLTAQASRGACFGDSPSITPSPESGGGEQRLMYDIDDLDHIQTDILVVNGLSYLQPTCNFPNTNVHQMCAHESTV